MPLKYKRVLLKLSGESLAGNNKNGIDNDTVMNICNSIKKCREAGLQLAIVVGGGNFWRGRTSEKMDRTKADQIGMLATCMNAIYLCDVLEQMGVCTKLFSAVNMQQIAKLYIRDEAVCCLNKGKVVVFACGTGSPYFSTDTAAALRAAEIQADVIFKATMVDGVYDKDPKKYEDAKRYNNISFADILNNSLQVMDMTAASLCKDNDMPLYVFSIGDPNNIFKAASGEDIGTLVN